MNALFLKDLADKIRHGQLGRIAEGRSAGSLPYGYEVVREFNADGEPVRGKRRVKEDETAVIRRVFEMHASGMAARAIAAHFNREGIPGPRGGQWNASTINGNRARRDGILWNELYIGRLIYNRQRFVKDPETGRRVPKLNPPEEWVVVEVPKLQVIDQDLWDRVHSIKARNAQKSVSRRRRPKRLLSGLLYCAACGDGYTVIGEERYGCSAKREKGTCTNGKTISVQKLEDRVLIGLKDRLLAPDTLVEFVREYQREWKRLKRDSFRRRARMEITLAQLDKRIARVLSAIEEGGDPVSLVGRLKELETERTQIHDELNKTDETSPVIDLHPNLAELYRRKVTDLQGALNADPVTRAEAVAILRSLIDKIVLHPGKKRGELSVELDGQLDSIVEFAHKKRDDVEVMKWVVAGEGLEPPTRGL